MRALLRHSLRIAHRFFQASEANVALTFGLVLIPMMAAVGAAVDYNRAGDVRAAMQSAADATALAAAKSWNALNASQLQQSADTWFMANLNGKKILQNVQVSTTGNSANNTIVVNVSGSINTAFLGLVGINQINLSVSSTATQGLTKLQVAMVLDNTGSMAEYGKMAALRTAAHQFLQQLQNAAQNPGDIQVAIIPFTTDVNVGTSNANASWLKWSYPAGGNGTITVSPSTWTGCVTDRDQDFDVKIDARGSGNGAAQFPAHDPWLGCPPQIVPLTTDWTALNNTVDQMVPLGETNLTIGLAWGWQALSAISPLNAPPPPPGTSQVIVFMTDGFNTANRWTNVLTGNGTTADIDARTKHVCKNIKDAGITVYTVQVDTGGTSPPSTLLQNCANSVSNWFYLQNPGDLVTTFSQIATKISTLRIAK